jgi:hypothetical protein
MQYYHPGNIDRLLQSHHGTYVNRASSAPPAPLMEAVNTCKRKADSNIEPEFASSDFAIALGVSSS